MNVIKILMCCGAGMSSSLLAKQLKKAAGKKGIPCIIEAQSDINIRQRVKNAHILLIAPHCMHNLNEFNKVAKTAGIPIYLIPHEIYGMQKGEELLSIVLDLLNMNEGD
ncbi:MAG: PTS sugar transporter subunit IIB [Hungatella sp.]|nr:PTS sugar transporter subunit IIB [Hungatella sp.]